MNTQDFIGSNAISEIYTEINDLCWLHRNKYASTELFTAVLLQRPEVQQFLKARGIEKIDVIANGLLREAEGSLKKSAHYAVGNTNDPMGNEFTRQATQLYEATGEDISKFSRIKRIAEEKEKINSDKRTFIKTIRYADNINPVMNKALTAAELANKNVPDGIDILKEHARRHFGLLSGDKLKHYGITKDLVLIDDEAFLREEESYKPEYRSSLVNETLAKKSKPQTASSSEEKEMKVSGEFVAQLKQALSDPEVRALIGDIFAEAIVKAQALLNPPRSSAVPPVKPKGP